MPAWRGGNWLPLGPPVTFHTRVKCLGGLLGYEDDWVAADPEHRVSSSRCSGRVTVHGDSGTYECTCGVDCPGLRSFHDLMSGCDCPGHTRGYPWPFPRNCRNLAANP